MPTALAVLGKWGSSVALVSKLGDDESGRSLRAELRALHVDTDHLVIDPNIATPQAFILIEQENGHRTVLLSRRPNNDLLPADLQKNLFRNCKMLHLDGHESAADLHAARLAKTAGALISIDIGSKRPVAEELLALIDIAIVSESYAEVFLRAGEPEQSAKMLVEKGAQWAAVTCGVQGSYFATRQQSLHQPAFPVKTVDTTGAGDAFHGAALFGILRGWNLKQVAVVASAAAAMACTRIGGKSGIPAPKQLKQFLQQQDVSVDFIEENKRREGCV